MPEQQSTRPRSNRKLRAGVGASCSVLIRFLHPSLEVRAKILNFTSSQRLENLLLVREEQKLVNHKNQGCFIFRHDDFPNVELYATTRYAKVVKEGAEVGLFNKEVSNNVNVVGVANHDSEEGEQGEALDDDVVEINHNVLNARNTAEDIMYVRGLGLTVDDDNAPAPENIPNSTTPNDEPLPSGLKESQSFGWDGFDDRKKNGNHNTKPQIKGLKGVALEGKLIVFIIMIELNKK